MRARLVTASLLVAAALANLPIVYRLVERDGTSPPWALGFGFVAMGLGWAAGFVIEGRKRWFVILASLVGVAEAGAAWLPVDLEGMVFMVAAGALSVAALALLALWKPARA